MIQLGFSIGKISKKEVILECGGIFRLEKRAEQSREQMCVTGVLFTSGKNRKVGRPDSEDLRLGPMPVDRNYVGFCRIIQGLENRFGS